jgi:hypothetical protein
MADEATATMEADTAEPTEAPVEQVTEQVETPETEAPTEAVTEQKPSLADFDDDTLFNEERVQRRINERLEQERASQQRKGALDGAKQAKAWVRDRGIQTGLEKIAERRANGDPIDDKDIQGLANGLYVSLVADVGEQATGLLKDLNPDLTRDQERLFTELGEAAQTNPEKVNDLLKFSHETYADKKVAEALAAKEKEIERRVRAELAGESKVAAVKAKPEVKGPTEVTGQAVSTANPNDMSIDEYASWKEGKTPAEIAQAWAGRG